MHYVVPIPQGLPVGEIVGVCGLRDSSPRPRRQVLKKLDAGPMRSPQAGNPQPRAKDVVQVLLLVAIVLAGARYAHSELIAIKQQACIGIADRDGGMVDSLEKFWTGLLPAWIALTRREMDDLKHMPIGITKIERLNPSCLRIPRGQRFGTARDMLNVMFAQPAVGL